MQFETQVASHDLAIPGTFHWKVVAIGAFSRSYRRAANGPLSGAEVYETKLRLFAFKRDPVNGIPTTTTASPSRSLPSFSFMTNLPMTTSTCCSPCRIPMLTLAARVCVAGWRPGRGVSSVFVQEVSSDARPVTRCRSGHRGRRHIDLRAAFRNPQHKLRPFQRLRSKPMRVRAASDADRCTRGIDLRRLRRGDRRGPGHRPARFFRGARAPNNGPVRTPSIPNAKFRRQ